MPQQLAHYFHFILVGYGSISKFFSNSAVPRVGDLVDLSSISSVKGEHKVLQVTYHYLTVNELEDGTVPNIEVLLEEQNSEPVKWR